MLRLLYLECFHRLFIVTRNPARHAVRQGMQIHAHAVLVFDAILHNIKLQHTDDAKELFVTSNGPENLESYYELLESLFF